VSDEPARVVDVHPSENERHAPAERMGVDAEADSKAG
jgi:hypothetical protein